MLEESSNKEEAEEVKRRNMALDPKLSIESAADTFHLLLLLRKAVIQQTLPICSAEMSRLDQVTHQQDILPASRQRISVLHSPCREQARRRCVLMQRRNDARDVLDRVEACEQSVVGRNADSRVAISVSDVVLEISFWKVHL